MADEKTSDQDTSPIEEPETVIDEVSPAPHPTGEDEVENTSSLASKVLTGLFLLVLGGGIALWAGPQIAPSLPAGLAPVAEFFAPQVNNDSDAQIAELFDTQQAFEDRIIARLEALEQADQDAASGLADLSERVSDASASVSSSDLTALRNDIEALDARLSDLAAAVQSGAVSEGDGSGTAAPALAALQSELDRLRAAQSDLARSVDQRTAALETQLTEATGAMATVSEAAELQLGSVQNRQLVIEIERALETGTPFSAVLENSDAEVPLELAAVATEGVSTLEKLQSAFPDLAYAAIRADLTAGADANLTDRLNAFLRKQVATRSLTPIEGDSTDAILSRMEDALQKDRLGDVLDESSALTAGPSAVLADWLDAVAQRRDAAAALTRFAGGSVTE